MRIIVSDSSCLIDIRKASLLDVFLKLPYEILIPNTLFEDQLIKFTAAQKSALRVFAEGHGLEVHGTLWVVDEMHHNHLAGATALLTALKLFRDDPTIHLPMRELASAIRRYESL